MKGKPELRRVVILGALSTIAEATARRLAAEGAALALVARDEKRLAAVANDLRLRGAVNVVTDVRDLEAEDDKRAALETLSKSLGGLDAVLLFYGALGDQATANENVDELRRIMSVNFKSAAEWMAAGADALKASQHRRPVLLAVSSVAGDRGRRSNYAYGAAKGGLSIFMQGLAHRLAAEGKTRAMVVKLGFVKSAMTAHLNPGGPLWAEPEAVAGSIVRAMDRGGPIVYAPWFWQWIMLAVRLTPAPIFNKVNL
ncbi:MAG: SDR family NAD(P)-dependent oxidoreductase [Parvularculaceae bacterium]